MRGVGCEGWFWRECERIKGARDRERRKNSIFAIDAISKAAMKGCFERGRERERKIYEIL